MHLQTGGECIQCLVKVIDLGNDKHHTHESKDIGGGFLELIVAFNSESDCNAECFDGHH